VFFSVTPDSCAFTASHATPCNAMQHNVHTHKHVYDV
jgi:hypothetical protein